MHSLLIVLMLAQPSQPPAPTPPKAGQEKQAVTNSQNTNTAVSPQLSPSATPSPTGTPPTQAKGDPAPNKNDQPPDDWVDVLSGLSNVVIAGLTIALFVVAWQEWELNRATLAASKAVDRAYIGVTVRLFTTWSPQHIVVTFSNKGRTPVRITDVRFRAFTMRVEDARKPPIPPDYVGGVTSFPSWQRAGFLVSNESMESSGVLIVNHENSGWYPHMTTHVIFLIGYCDYIDVFGDRHRRGWARQYVPKTNDRAHSLAPIAAMGYNYDRPRVKDEGLDWGEHAEYEEPS